MKLIQENDRCGESDCFSSLEWTHYSVADLTLGDIMENSLHPLVPGTIIGFKDGTVIIIGDATPYMQPTTSDGGIGWIWDSGHCSKKVAYIIVIHLDDIEGTDSTGNVVK